MLAAETIQLTLSNDSSLTFRRSPDHPPILQGCTDSGPSGSPCLLEGSGAIVRLECEETAHGGSAFLTYFSGDFKKTLMIWLCMKPEAGSDIKFGIFDKVPQLDHDVLKKIAKDEITLETIGFGKDLLWIFKDEKGLMHEISMAVDIGSTGHHLEAQLIIREQSKSLANESSQPVKAFYKVSASIIGTIGWDRVHEDMAICSLINAGMEGFSMGTTYMGILGRGYSVNAPASWEFIRGVLWNDDPACDFFYDLESNNGYFQAWAGFYSLHFSHPGPNLPGHITYRSHHGDLQFVHGMATSAGEFPEETKRKIMLWLEIMYRLSVGDGIQETDRIDSTGLTEFFNDNTVPKGSQTLRDLLVGSTPSARDTDIKRRALGTCIHLIQDSYAVGHCRRTLRNPEDMIDVQYARHLDTTRLPGKAQKIFIKGFTKDKPGHFSDIKTFHCYVGQDKRHDYYDQIPNREKLDPSDPSSFYCLVGAMDALRDCTSLARAWIEKRVWEDKDTGEGVDQMMESTFRLTSDATPSDTKVDEDLWAWRKPSDA